MAAIGTMNVTVGSNTVASEVPYVFSVYPWGTLFKPVGAVYVITKSTIKLGGSADHSLIYVGYTDDLSTCFDNHHKTDCFERYGANCICVLGVEDEQLRSRLVSEVADGCDPVCND